MHRVVTSAVGEEPLPKGKPLINKVIDPEIQRFENYFKVLAGPLTPIERELLRSYLYYKLVSEKSNG